MSGATVQDYAAIATMSILLPGVTVGKGALVGAHSSVNRDVAADTVVAGSPAKFICETSKVKLKDGSGNAAYPWRKHFHRGYPEEGHRLAERIQPSCVQLDNAVSAAGLRFDPTPEPGLPSRPPTMVTEMFGSNMSKNKSVSKQ